jgi:hypothetical protein
MAIRAAIGRCRSAAPVCAFLAGAALSVLLAAQAQLACTRQMVMTMPAGMPPMAMTADTGTLALCPVVLVLGLAAVLLTLYAGASFVADPHRSVTRRALIRRYARIPLHTAAGAVLAIGSGSVASMMALDGSTPSGISGWLLLGGIVAGVALATSVAGVAIVRTILAFSRCVAMVLAAERHVVRRGVPAPALARRTAAPTVVHRVPLLAARRGLRAPPIFGR